MPSARTSQFDTTAIATPEPEPERRTGAFVPSSYQQAIFDWFGLSSLRTINTGTGAMGVPNARSLIVRARAGTGKTTTILHAIDRAPEARILLCAFNKRIQEEMASRLTNPRAEALTLHALGYRALRQAGGITRTCQRFEREDDLAAQVSKGLPYGASRLVAKLVTKAREIEPITATVDSLIELALDFDLMPPPGDTLSVEDVARATLRAMHIAATVRPVATGIDFADMIFLPLVNNLVTPSYDMVVVDEAQDMTTAQLELARRSCVPGGRIVIVGDDRQCQPAGTMVRSSEAGNVPLESLKVGDTIESFDRHGQVFIKTGRVSQIAARDYSGPLIRVAAGSHVTRCTPNHKWLVRWTSRDTDQWVTYVMRRGDWWRVGQCQAFTNAGEFHLAQRARLEDADEAWVLGIHSTVSASLVHEKVVSAEYGLCQVMFNPVHGNTSYTQEFINAVFSSLDADAQRNRAHLCLKEHDRDAHYPLYEKTVPYARRGRTTLFETQACNLMSGHMAVAVAPDVIPGHNKKDRHAVAWESVTVASEPFEGVVYSLDIERYHKYVADGLVTCNSIYAFRGADSGSLDRLKIELNAQETPLSKTYRCPKSVVAVAQKFVPDYEVDASAPVGVVDEIATLDDLVTAAQPANFILSRRNAPLARVCLRLLRAGKPAKIQGRDIGAGLKTLIRFLAKGDAAHSIPKFLARLESYEAKQVVRFIAMKHEERVDALRDKCDTLRWLAEDVSGVPALNERIDSLFTDVPGASIICSSVHKAKGLEAQRVFILRSTFFMSAPCKACGKRVRQCVCETFMPNPERQREEENIYYVAVTRAQAHLTLCLEKL